MPGLRNWSWPERGAKAEYDSLLYQAGRHVCAKKPSNWDQVAEQVLLQYPKTYVPRGMSDEDFQQPFESQQLALDLEGILRRDVVMKSSPGVPLIALGRENSAVLQQHRVLVLNAVLERIRLYLTGQWRGKTPRQLVELGYCDPIRVFVKQEPHKEEKVRSRRFRLICSVSLVDQIVERVISGIQNRAEIRSWFKIPSVPGIGFSDEQIKVVWDIVSPHLSTAVQTDVEGWDWSVQDWELEGNAEMQIVLAQANTHSAYAEITRARAFCLSNSVFSLSDGTLISQVDSGIQKSGSYTTSSGNSRMRVAAAFLCGSTWARAMGDDCIEVCMSRDWEAIRGKYLSIGHRMKALEPCGRESFEFCSSVFSLRDGSPIAEPENWSRTFYRLLNQKDKHADVLAQFMYEMRHSKHLQSCLEVLFRVGWYPENSPLEESFTDKSDSIRKHGEVEGQGPQGDDQSASAARSGAAGHH